MDKVQVKTPFDRISGMMGLQFLEGKKIGRQFDFVGMPLTREHAIRYVAGQQYALYANALKMFSLHYIRENNIRSSDDIPPEARESLLNIMQNLIPSLIDLQAFSNQGQALFLDYQAEHGDLAKESFYTNEKTGKDEVLRTVLAPLYDKMLAKLDSADVVYVPAGSQQHVVIVKIEKRNDLEYTLSEYNAGYGAQSAGGWTFDKTVTTDEDTNRTKKGVFGSRRWEIKGQDAEDATHKLRTVIDLYSQRHLLPHFNYDYLQTKLDKELAAPVNQTVVHVQDQPNCSTRTCRELIRGNLQPAMYAEFMNYLQKQARLESLKRVSDTQSMHDAYLEHYFNAGFNQLAIAMGISKSPSSSSEFSPAQLDNWLIRLDDRSPAAMTDIFKNIRHPSDPNWLCISPEALQRLFDDLHQGVDVIQAFERLGQVEKEKPLYDASNAGEYFKSFNTYSDSLEVPPVNHVGWQRATAYHRSSNPLPER